MDLMSAVARRPAPKEEAGFLSSISLLKRRAVVVVASVAAPALLIACEEQSPVGIGGGPLPGEPVTVEVTIPWSDFASALEVFGGYGSPQDLGQGVLALQYEGTLDARTLLRFAEYPDTATVRDSTGTSRPDGDLTFVGGRLVTRFDTIASTNGTTPVTLAIGRTETEWDATTASWDFAIDTINDQRPWPEPGGGPVTPVDTAVWDPAEGDSAVFELDSATIAAWSDPSDLTSGARIEMIDAGHRVRLTGATLRLDARPSLNPDTIIQVNAFTSAATFLYTPFPTPPPDGVRIGGAPAWRTLLDVSIPEVLDGIPELCAVVECPYTLTPVEISFAALLLTSRETEAAFQPSDSIRLDVRPVFDRSAMPKSPLGPSLVEGDLGRPVPPEAFGSAPGQPIEIPFTTFARDLLRGFDDRGNPAPGTLALLSVFEPFSISFASFEGPGNASEPVLKLVLTIGPPVELP
ncbi:MAG: hypothetical protein AMS19_09295 [Gemmatimonas sp. SG8_23]|jgi:hypothetical protein|nr:MAG: hypothetical protein AMS19_09295 [Gemmatimonas sp. SG8_23]